MRGRHGHLGDKYSHFYHKSAATFNDLQIVVLVHFRFVMAFPMLLPLEISES